ncbi:MAG: type II secretion system minor pseudopilin [Thermodesulfovibrionales bacterium]
MRTGRRGRPSDERGIALMMVLWILVLLSIIALNHLRSTRLNTAATSAMKEESVAYYLALSGYHEALQYLMSDKDPVYNFQDDADNYHIDREIPPVTGLRKKAGGEVDIRISDEDAKININLVSPEDLRRLFTYAGLKEDDMAEVIDSILDWKDPDTDHHLSGAEDEYYEQREEPHKAKNGSFDLPEELLLVKGFRPEYLYGGKDFRGVLPLITTFGKGAININTASKGVMDFLGLNEFEIEAVFKQRSAEAGGFRFVPPQFASRGFSTLASNTLRVEVTGRADNSRVLSRIVAVLNRKSTGTGYLIQTIYWRESVENGRG